MQESGLRNLPHLGPRNDHDFIGVFQQRQSQGWGTLEQLAQPAYQAGKFFDKFQTIPRWESMTLTQAGQAVQVSAYPDAYAKWTTDAAYLVDRLTEGAPSAASGDSWQCLPAVCPSANGDQAGDCTDISAAFSRAQSWLTASAGGPVPYFSSGDPRDCSRATDSTAPATSP